MIKKLYQLAGGRRDGLNRGAILTLISAVFAASPLFFIYLTINEELFAESVNFQRVMLYVIGMAVCFLLHWVFLYKSNNVLYQAGIGMLTDLRIRLGEHIRKLPMGFFFEEQAGDLNSVINWDVTNIQPVPTYVFPRLIETVTVPTFIAAFLFFLNWRMALATLIVLPFAAVVMRAAMKSLDRQAKIRAESSVEANPRMIEYVQGIQVSKAFNQTGLQTATVRAGPAPLQADEYRPGGEAGLPYSGVCDDPGTGLCHYTAHRVLPLLRRQPHAENPPHLPGSGSAALRLHQEYVDFYARVEDYGCLPGANTVGAK